MNFWVLFKRSNSLDIEQNLKSRMLEMPLCRLCNASTAAQTNTTLSNVEEPSLCNAMLVRVYRSNSCHSQYHLSFMFRIIHHFFASSLVLALFELISFDAGWVLAVCVAVGCSTFVCCTVPCCTGCVVVV